MTQQTVDDTRYVAFCDILGFSNRIQKNFDAALEAYRTFGDFVSEKAEARSEITIYSDAILVTDQSLKNVLSTAQSVWFFALAHNLMIRGAITKGRYWARRSENHLLVASDALVRAVKLEKLVGIPAVVLADDVEIPDDYWLTRFVAGPFGTSLLHFRDRNIVNPFNIFWGKSAAHRARQLMDESPEYRDKYLWFLALHEAVSSGQPLIPPDVLARFLREGKLKIGGQPHNAID